MKDPDFHRTHPIAEDVLSDSAMDQALDWLIELDTADARQQARFQDAAILSERALVFLGLYWR